MHQAMIFLVKLNVHNFQFIVQIRLFKIKIEFEKA